MDDAEKPSAKRANKLIARISQKKIKAGEVEPMAKRAKTSSSSSSDSSSSSSDSSSYSCSYSDDAEDETKDDVEIKKSPDSDLPVASSTAAPLAPSMAEDGEADKAENIPLALKNDPFMSEWTKETLHYHSNYPRATVELLKGYLQDPWNDHDRQELLNAIMGVAKILTELEGKDIEECKEDVDKSQKYGAGMNWARHFSLKFLDTEHAMTIHEYVSFTPLLCTVRLSKSSE